MEACELLATELRLDRIEAELAIELPPHLRMFARAHAQGLPSPPAPDVLHRATTLATARAALSHPLLADRGLALVRLVAPVALEADPAVAAARAAAPTWTALAALAAARDAAAQARFGRRAIEVIHRLHGSAIDLARLAAEVGGGVAGGGAPSGHGAPGRHRVPGSADGASGGNAPGGSEVRGARDGLGSPKHIASGADHAAPGGGDALARGEGDARGLPPAVAGWFEPDGVAVDDRAVAAAWEVLRMRHGVEGTVQFERAAGARPRAFVVEPGRCVVIAIPTQIAAPAERFAVLHELGHAVAALALPPGIPRVVDEAAAAYIARAIERDGDPWFSPRAAVARARRSRLARLLDGIERALPDLPVPPMVSERPPWALWHDPGAQAAYVAAEALADAIVGAIGAAPGPGVLVAALAAWRDPIDRLGSAPGAI
jgi:hypothetical protein